MGDSHEPEDFILAGYGVVSGPTFQEDLVTIASRIMSGADAGAALREIHQREQSREYGLHVATEASKYLSGYAIQVAPDVIVPILGDRLTKFWKQARTIT